MLGFRSQFEGPIWAAAVLALLVMTLAVLVVIRGRADRPTSRRQAARVLAVGVALVVVVATVMPDSWPPVLSADGDLALPFGAGGLRDWRVLVEQPDSLAAVLLVANFLLYVPLGFFAHIGWQRSLPVLASAATLSLLVEVSQWQALGRVGSTDDFLLNISGATMGLLLALMVRATTRQSTVR